MNTCKNICTKLISKKKQQGKCYIERKRCTVCDVYIRWELNECPCCGVPLRVKPRHGKAQNPNKTNVVILNNDGTVTRI